ncbi:DoxX family membrane protein [Gordonia amarae]|mgnify:CR=1 FL=1|uniref:DoxX family protein n=2 Tax=Gordonia amarae TaxID=36821 RepID=G7GSL2_9ACTN|nr:DoxX family protein [Gordonia amarae]MCS3879432.1 putative membrane protein YphA (DoxX/SURF4 family) [Gordonia amarae]QHN17906.1 DoxX family membrane protein [Gordonia amarae]QHN22428.1 DoxX family membrane protein [Gordonia amarae]QHN31304.1 DoxX family membrane protein [Gordonia amarae]QHN40049.1 DoxX family membrane protein [Gordonia amarae]
MILRRIARPMLASVFVVGGVDSLRNPAGKAAAAQGFIDGSVQALPDTVTANVPTDAETVIRVNGAIQVAAGLLLASGKFPRPAAALLAGSLVPTTVAGHAFWNETDPALKAQQRTQFVKNVSLLGGLLIAAADTEGKPSLGWRGRRAAETVVAALPVGAGTSASAWDSLRSKAAEGAEAVAERSAGASETVQDAVHALEARGAGVAAKARDHAPQVAEAARGIVSDVAVKTRDRAPEVVEAARERAPEVAQAARELASTAAEAAADKAKDGQRLWRKARAAGTEALAKSGSDRQ